MGEIVKALVTSLLGSQWPLLAIAILCGAAGWWIRGAVEKKNKRNESEGSRLLQLKENRTENRNEYLEDKTVAEPSEVNGITEMLEWAERNKGSIFIFKEVWEEAIEPIIDMNTELGKKIQKAGISYSSFVKVRGISKEGRQLYCYIGKDELEDKEKMNGTLGREMPNDVVQMSVEIQITLSFAKIDEKKHLGIKGVFHKPKERIAGEWKDSRPIFYSVDGKRQDPRRGYDREGIYEMLEEQVMKAIESWRKASC